MSEANSESGESSEVPMIFELIDDVLVPLLPGSPAADGVTYLNVSQCVARLGGTEQSWRDRWLSTWGKFFPSGILDGAPGAATEGSAGAAPISRVNLSTEQIRNASAAAGWHIVRALRFRHLDDAQWNYVQRECVRKHLDPADVWVELQTNPETKEIDVVIITTLKSVRMIGARTGRRRNEMLPMFAGEDGVFKPGPWVGPKHPTAAKVGILLDTGELVEGVAYWDMCAQCVKGPDGVSRLTEYWQKGDAHMLGKCASVAAHRNAFPLECEGIFSTDERPVPRSGPAELEARADSIPTRPADSGVFKTIKDSAPKSGPDGIPDDPRMAMSLVDEATPELSNLALQLVMRGPFRNITAANSFILGCQRRWPKIFRAGEKPFCAIVMKAAMDGPEAAAA